jgi:ABC-type Fe3+-siderophore transport system permease subunit
MSTPTTIPCLLYFAALFLTVATLWILLYADPNEGSSPRDFFVSIVVVMPFVMLVYFGLAVIICNKISVARGWRTALPLQLTSSEALTVAVTYIGLAVWLWLRWRKLRIRQRGIPR